MRKPISEETREKMRQARLGKKWSDEIKLKFRLAKLGKRQSEEHRSKYKGRVPWNKGKSSVYSEDAKRLMREAKVGKTPPAHKPNCKCFRCSPKSGKLNHNFVNGCTDDRNRLRRELRQWSRSVMMRDKFSCVMCHQVGGKLNAHHIRTFADYPELRLNVNNGVTLCEPCHRFVMKKESEYEKLFESLLSL